jgi:hypothetical protein
MPRAFRVALIFLAMLIALVAYDWRAFRNMGTQEAMDSAQLARNIAEGNGYNTLFVRPFSIFLLQRQAAVAHGIAPEFAFKNPAAARLNQRLVEDVANYSDLTNTVSKTVRTNAGVTNNIFDRPNPAIPLIAQTNANRTGTVSVSTNAPSPAGQSSSNSTTAGVTHPGTPRPPKLKDMHPDLANAPVYPIVLAGLMKVLPFYYEIPTRSQTFWSQDGMFARYEPDFIIAAFNQLLLFGLIFSVFFLAKRLFDSTVAWLTAVLMLGTELLWRFSVSGLSTILLLLIFTGLVWCLVLFESEAREPKRGPQALLALAAIVGAVVGIGGLTRYAFGWLIIPVLVYMVLFAGPRRVSLALVALAVFAGVMAPWIARNYHLSGTPFGTAGYAVLENTFLFPENKLQRSLDPELSRLYILVYGYKLVAGLRIILQNDLPKLGGSWVSAFFLAGLMVGFRSPALRRLRIFLLMALGTLAVAQALGRTQLSEESPEINSENLLVLLSPLILVYGVSLFITLLDQMNLPTLEFRYLITAAAGLVACLPVIFVFLPPHSSPVTWPPYSPPHIQIASGWVKENELTMSDVPWAMAWYGHRQCVWLTLKATPDRYDPTTHEDFFAINDYMKPICILYLTPQTMDSKYLTQWVLAERSWGNFIRVVLENKDVPSFFPLHCATYGWLPKQILLADWERWNR